MGPIITDSSPIVTLRLARNLEKLAGFAIYSASSFRLRQCDRTFKRKLIKHSYIRFRDIEWLRKSAVLGFHIHRVQFVLGVWVLDRQNSSLSPVHTAEGLTDGVNISRQSAHNDCALVVTLAFFAKAACRSRSNAAVRKDQPHHVLYAMYTKKVTVERECECSKRDT